MFNIHSDKFCLVQRNSLIYNSSIFRNVILFSSGECGRVARSIYVGLSVFCLLQAGWCTLLWGYDLSVPADFSVNEGTSQWGRTFHLLYFPSGGTNPVQTVFLLLLLFSFHLPDYIVIFLATFVVWGLLPALSSILWELFHMYIFSKQFFTNHEFNIFLKSSSSVG